MNNWGNSQYYANYPPLVYHYGGSSIPDYAQVTLRKIARRWPTEVFLLHSCSRPPAIKGVNFQDFRSWYSPEPFQDVLKATQMDGEFREGFWLHALERFFVLRQWLAVTGRQRLLHAELDVRLFDHGDLFERLDSVGAAVFIPRASPEQAGANWLYCNDPGSLGLIVGEFCRRAAEGFEMQLLARFMDDFPSRVQAVPSHTSVENDDPTMTGHPGISLQEVGRIVDVHPLGTWLLGHDPRNTPNKPVFNHFFYEELGSERLRAVRYHFSWRLRSLEVSHKGGPRYPVVALHVHSKIMRRAHSDIFLAIYSWLANQNFDSLVIPQKFGSYLTFLARKVRDGAYLRVKKLFSIGY